MVFPGEECVVCGDLLPLSANHLHVLGVCMCEKWSHVKTPEQSSAECVTHDVTNLWQCSIGILWCITASWNTCLYSSMIIHQIVQYYYNTSYHWKHEVTEFRKKKLNKPLLAWNGRDLHLDHCWVSLGVKQMMRNAPLINSICTHCITYTYFSAMQRKSVRSYLLNRKGTDDLTLSMHTVLHVYNISHVT